MAFKGLNLFGEKAEAGLLDSDIGVGEGSITYHSITESMDVIGSFLHSLTEGYAALLESGNIDSVGFEESAGLSARISKLNNKKKKIEDSIESLKSDRKKAEKGSKEAESIDKKIEKAEKKLSFIKDKVEKFATESVDQTTNSVKDICILNESLDDIGSDMDELLTESNIHGSVTIPGGTSPHPEVDQRPKSSKTEITVDVYNDVIGTLQKSFKEMADIVGSLSNVTVVQESTQERIEREQSDYLENAIDQAILEAFENGPIFEAVDRSDKKEVKTIVSKIRGNIASKLKAEDVSYYKPNIVARIIMTAIPAGAAAIGVFWKERLWQILGVCHLESGNISSIMKILNEEYKEDLGSYKIIAAKTNPTIHDLFKTKFGWKNHKNTYFLLIDKKLPAELKEFQTAVDKAINSEDKKEDEAIKECEEYSLDDYSIMIESAYIEAMSDSGAELNEDVLIEASLLYECFDAVYALYTEACKKCGKKKLSKEECAEKICKACNESSDEDFSEESALLESSAEKMVKKNVKQIAKSDLGNKLDDEQKAIIKQVSKDAVKLMQKGYNAYKKLCSSSGVTPKSKKEFVSLIMSDDSPDKNFLTELDDATSGALKKKYKSIEKKFAKKHSKQYAEYGKKLDANSILGVNTK